MMLPQFVRLAETGRAELVYELDGEPATALAGDTVMTAILTRRGHLRLSEFGDGARAGFCLMGACQDCWVTLGDGRRVRACSTLVSAGLVVRTVPAPLAPAVTAPAKETTAPPLAAGK
jgi:predicted molibdopterin-dependent oxidoreductase YjgC